MPQGIGYLKDSAKKQKKRKAAKTLAERIGFNRNTLKGTIDRSKKKKDR